MASERASQRAFFGVSALLFTASTALTIVWCASMTAMGEMPMPGGWTISMAWMRMPGQTWPGAAASFLRMWVVMMVAMMLPSLVPMLWRYRHSVGTTGEARLGRLTALVGVGYFFVWTVFGTVVFWVGVAVNAHRLGTCGRSPELLRRLFLTVSDSPHRGPTQSRRSQQPEEQEFLYECANRLDLFSSTCRSRPGIGPGTKRGHRLVDHHSAGDS
jgi:hypothetical protein